MPINKLFVVVLIACRLIRNRSCNCIVLIVKTILYNPFLLQKLFRIYTLHIIHSSHMLNIYFLSLRYTNVTGHIYKYHNLFILCKDEDINELPSC